MTHDLQQLPTECPVCGAASIAPSSRRSTLLAVCDALVIKTLEKLGKSTARQHRPLYRLHTERGVAWPELYLHAAEVTPAATDLALEGAWDVAASLLDAHGLTEVDAPTLERFLSQYVHDLTRYRLRHTAEALADRFEQVLGLRMYLPEVAHHGER